MLPESERERETKKTGGKKKREPQEWDPLSIKEAEKQSQSCFILCLTM